MKILASNDDGYKALGLQLLSKALASFAEVTIVAPTTNRSASSCSLSVKQKLTLSKHTDNIYSVDGTASDCVHLAMLGPFRDKTFDMVIAGVNHGPNLGDDTIYSGTLGAAIEGRFLKYPPVAFSFVSTTLEHIADACSVAKDVLLQLIQCKSPPKMVYNVNIPPLARDKMKGIKITRLGERQRSQLCSLVTQNGETKYYSLGGVSPAIIKHADDEDTDFGAIKAGFVSVTPLALDRSHLPQIALMRAEFDNFPGF